MHHKPTYTLYYISREGKILYAIRAVSYTHLRAHETDSYLVCRLLLEKKNSSQGSNTRERVNNV